MRSVKGFVLAAVAAAGLFALAPKAVAGDCRGGAGYSGYSGYSSPYYGGYGYSGYSGYPAGYGYTTSYGYGGDYCPPQRTYGYSGSYGYYDRGYSPGYRSYAYDNGYGYGRHCRIVRENFNGHFRKVRQCW